MMRVAQLRVLGGAMARVPADATAFAHRDRGSWSTSPRCTRTRRTSARTTWASGLAEALQPGRRRRVRQLPGLEGQARVRAAYPGATWERLVAIKRRYDPDNLFRHNQNIEPGPA